MAEQIAVEPVKIPTFRTSGPARLSKSLPSPMLFKSDSVPAEMNSPQTFLRGNCAFSIIATFQPARAKRNAAVAPAGPAPMMRASRSMTNRSAAIGCLPRRSRGVGEPLGRETMAERPSLLLVNEPIAARPKRRYFLAFESGAHADDRIMP